MTTPKAGDVVHALVSGFTYPVSSELTGGRVTRRGETIELTDDMLAAARDRNGDSFWDIVDDTEAQAARWGAVVFARGAAPAELETWLPGTPEHAIAREKARLEAWLVSNPVERAAALHEVERRYGPRADQTLLVRRGEG